jgi:hypothetical protein
MVRYIDYDIQELPSFNRMQLIMHKRHFFADEREVRAVMWSIAPENVRHEHVDPFLTADRIGFLASIDPKKLLHSVVLHPKATAELVLRISEICSAHGLPQPVPSRIASRPQF